MPFAKIQASTTYYTQYVEEAKLMSWSNPSGTSATISYSTEGPYIEMKPKVRKTPEKPKSDIILAIGESRLFADYIILLLSKDHDITGADILSLLNYSISARIFVIGQLVDGLPLIGQYKGAIIINALDECGDTMDRASIIKEYMVGIRRDMSSPFMLIISKKLNDEDLEEALYIAGSKNVWKPNEFVLENHSFMAGR